MRVRACVCACLFAPRCQKDWPNFAEMEVLVVMETLGFCVIMLIKMWKLIESQETHLTTDDQQNIKISQIAAKEIT